EKGLLSVNDPITKHLPDYPKIGDGITIHHLLTHTSGIPSYTGVPEYQKNMRVAFTTAQMIDGFKDKPLEFTPGEKFKYDNSGYFLLGAIIEKISGQAYDQYLQTHIFDPLGMKDSGYDRPQTLLKRRAAGYEWSAAGLRNTEYLDMGQPFAAGSLYSTVEDLFHAAHRRGRNREVRLRVGGEHGAQASDDRARWRDQRLFHLHCALPQRARGRDRLAQRPAAGRATRIAERSGSNPLRRALAV
ncbi:MAG: hypothetical protein DMF91_28360, partial [Acidobacteria bacterium]